MRKQRDNVGRNGIPAYRIESVISLRRIGMICYAITLRSNDPPAAPRKRCRMFAKSAATPDASYDIVVGPFGKSSLVVPEFKSGVCCDANHLQGEPCNLLSFVDILENDDKGPINIGPPKEAFGLNWAFGAAYSARQPFPEPASPSGQHAPISEPFPGPINPEWRTGAPHGKQRRRHLYPDFRIFGLFGNAELEFAMITGRGAVLAGNRAMMLYRPLTNTRYAVEVHMLKMNDMLRKNGRILRPGDCFANQFPQTTVAQEIIPTYRGPTPSLQILPVFPYDGEEVPDILPKFRKDVEEGRISLSGRTE